MASTTSVISFLILLLATYSYSAPFKHEYEKSTPKYEFTTGTTIVERGDSFNMHLISDDESTDASHLHKERSAEESNSEEVTTSDDVTLSPRSFEDSPFSTSTSTSSSSDESNEKRSLDEFSFTTMESSTEFDRRAIRPHESQEEIETSTSFVSDNSVEMTTHFEPSSSVNSFGKFTGLLHNDETEEKFTTPEYEKHDRSSEESTTRVPVKTQRITKTVSIFPGKITETKIYLNLPTEKTITTVNVDERELVKPQQPVITTTVPVEEIEH